MKKLLLSLAVVATMLASCSDDDPKTVPAIEGNTINGGDLTENHTLEGEIKLDGALFVKEGATLTIKEGATITASNIGVKAYILIERGAKIMAEGTADKPITFTSSGTGAGSWGGLIVNGYAPIAGGGESATEIATTIKFGGDKATDNSGVLKYLIIEKTGASINDDAEHNGLTLNGVGSTTQISNIMIKNGDDDGIEFFGGTVSVTNLLVVNAKDDMFDFTMGYVGKLENAYGVREAGYTARTSDPRGIEADGNKDGKFPDHTNQSDITIKDITIQNLATSDAEGNGRLDDAIKIRRGAKATITNALVTTNVTEQTNINVKDVIDLVDKRGAAVDATAISCTISENITWKVGTETDNEDKTGKVTFGGTVPTEAEGNTGADKTKFAWTGYTFK